MNGFFTSSAVAATALLGLGWLQLADFAYLALIFFTAVKIFRIDKPTFAKKF